MNNGENFPDSADDWAAPDGHEKIKGSTLGFLTITNDGHLHWKKKKVVTQQESKIVFGFVSGLVAFLVAISSISIGAVTVNNEFCFVEVGRTCRPLDTDSDRVPCKLEVLEGELSVSCPPTAAG